MHGRAWFVGCGVCGDVVFAGMWCVVFVGKGCGVCGMFGGDLRGEWWGYPRRGLSFV